MTNQEQTIPESLKELITAKAELERRRSRLSPTIDPETILFAFQNSLTGEQCRSREVSEAERVQRFNDFEDGFRSAVKTMIGWQGRDERRGAVKEYE